VRCGQESEGSPQISPWHDIKLKVSPVSASASPLPPPPLPPLLPLRSPPRLSTHPASPCTAAQLTTSARGLCSIIMTRRRVGSQKGVYNLLTEIPKMSKAKMEVMTKEPLNPIAQV
jgi:hypothetical protein